MCEAASLRLLDGQARLLEAMYLPAVPLSSQEYGSGTEPNVEQAVQTSIWRQRLQKFGQAAENELRNVAEMIRFIGVALIELVEKVVRRHAHAIEVVAALAAPDRIAVPSARGRYVMGCTDGTHKRAQATSRSHKRR